MEFGDANISQSKQERKGSMEMITIKEDQFEDNENAIILPNIEQQQQQHQPKQNCLPFKLFPMRSSEQINLNESQDPSAPIIMEQKKKQVLFRSQTKELEKKIFKKEMKKRASQGIIFGQEESSPRKRILDSIVKKKKIDFYCEDDVNLEEKLNRFYKGDIDQEIFKQFNYSVVPINQVLMREKNSISILIKGQILEVKEDSLLQVQGQIQAQEAQLELLNKKLNTLMPNENKPIFATQPTTFSYSGCIERKIGPGHCLGENFIQSNFYSKETINLQRLSLLVVENDQDQSNSNEAQSETKEGKKDKKKGKTVLLTEKESHFIIISKEGFQEIETKCTAKEKRWHIDFLRSFSFMRDLPTFPLLQLLSGTHFRELCRGDVVYKEKQIADRIYFIREGEVEISKIVRVKAPKEEEQEEGIISEQTNTNCVVINDDVLSEVEEEREYNNVPKSNTFKKRVSLKILNEQSYFGQEELLKKEQLRKYKAVVTSLTCFLFGIDKDTFQTVLESHGFFEQFMSENSMKQTWQESRQESYSKVLEEYSPTRRQAIKAPYFLLKEGGGDQKQSIQDNHDTQQISPNRSMLSIDSAVSSPRRVRKADSAMDLQNEEISPIHRSPNTNSPLHRNASSPGKGFSNSCFLAHTFSASLENYESQRPKESMIKLHSVQQGGSSTQQSNTLFPAQSMKFIRVLQSAKDSMQSKEKGNHTTTATTKSHILQKQQSQPKITCLWGDSFQPLPYVFDENTEIGNDGLPYQKQTENQIPFFLPKKFNSTSENQLTSNLSLTSKSKTEQSQQITSTTTNRRETVRLKYQSIQQQQYLNELSQRTIRRDKEERETSQLYYDLSPIKKDILISLVKKAKESKVKLAQEYVEEQEDQQLQKEFNHSNSSQNEFRCELPTHPEIIKSMSMKKKHQKQKDDVVDIASGEVTIKNLVHNEQTRTRSIEKIKGKIFRKKQLTMMSEDMLSILKTNRPSDILAYINNKKQIASCHNNNNNSNMQFVNSSNAFQSTSYAKNNFSNYFSQNYQNNNSTFYPARAENTSNYFLGEHKSQHQSVEMVSARRSDSNYVNYEGEEDALKSKRIPQQFQQVISTHYNGYLVTSTSKKNIKTPTSQNNQPIKILSSVKKMKIAKWKKAKNDEINLNGGNLSQQDARPQKMMNQAAPEIQNQRLLSEGNQDGNNLAIEQVNISRFERAMNILHNFRQDSPSTNTLFSRTARSQRTESQPTLHSHSSSIKVKKLS